MYKTPNQRQGAQSKMHRGTLTEFACICSKYNLSAFAGGTRSRHVQMHHVALKINSTMVLVRNQRHWRFQYSLCLKYTLIYTNVPLHPSKDVHRVRLAGRGGNVNDTK